MLKYGKNFKFFNNAFNLFYENNLTNCLNNSWINFQTFPITGETNRNNLRLLKHYENSYFWVTKRFYNFNSLNSNRINSTTQFLNTYLSDIKFKRNVNLSSLNEYFVTLPYLFKLFNLSNSQFSLDCELLNKSSNQTTSGVSNNSFLFKDVNLLLNENEIFENEVLSNLQWITSTTGNTSHDLKFFNYLFYLTDSDNVIFEKFLNTEQRYKLNTWNEMLLEINLIRNVTFSEDFLFFNVCKKILNELCNTKF